MKRLTGTNDPGLGSGLGSGFVKRLAVRYLPPPMRYEPPPPMPVAGMSWVGGYWIWDDGEWAWMSGARRRG